MWRGLGDGAGRRVGAIAIALFAMSAAFAPAAQALDLKLTRSIVERDNGDYGYVAPDTPALAGTVVLGTSSDTYECPEGRVASGFLPVGVTTDSNSTSLSVSYSGVHKSRIDANVGTWSLDRVFFRAVVSCTNDRTAFPEFHGRGCSGNFTDAFPTCLRLGEYWTQWDAALVALGNDRKATDADFAELIRNAFCWKAGWPCPTGGQPDGGKPVENPVQARAAQVAAPTRARSQGNRFALRNGTNNIALTFSHPASSKRPPAVLLKGATGCRAQRMHTTVQNGVGRLDLVLACRGLRRGGMTRITIREAIRRSFRLRRGTGKLRIRLDKPPGSVEPYVYASSGRAARTCRRTGHRFRLRPTEHDLTISLRCGRAATNGIGHLYVGGLLAADREGRSSRTG